MSSDPAPAPPGPRPDTSRAAVLDLVHLLPHFAVDGVHKPECLTCRVTEAVGALLDDREAWKEAAQHLRYCRTCAEDGLKDCPDGRLIAELLGEDLA